MSLDVYYLQHTPGEGPGGAAAWAAERGHRLIPLDAFDQPTLPDPAEVGLLIVLGGAMNVGDTDRHSWLLAEKRFLREVLEAERPVLGICLGSQLVAEALGATVAANPRPEIGWFPVERAAGAPEELFPERVDAFHWHEQRWGLPPGATLLAGSAACDHQAFAWGDRVLGLQFHPEMTGEIASCILHGEEVLPAGEFVQTDDLLARPERFAAGHRFLFAALDRLAARSTSSAAA